jgi:hypothetical protein
MKHHYALLICAALGGNCIHAAEPPVVEEAGQLRYPSQWYSRFAPRTALDMVRQTPGFTLDEGEERRGLSGAVGNVLIDGRRPSAKEQGLEEILQRIPAAQVESIEILRGAQTAGDASGEAVLLNVLRTPFTGQGVGSLGFEYAQQHEPRPNGYFAWTGRARSVDYSIGGSSYSLARELPGTRELSDASGNVTGFRRDTSPRDFSEYALNGEAGIDAAGGRLRLTGQASYSRYDEDSVVETYDAAGSLLGSDFNPYAESKRGGEFGGQFDRELGAWHLSSLLLLTRNRFENDITSTHGDAAGIPTSVFAQHQLQDSGESIVRATLAREFRSGHRFETGVEGAFNTLDANLALTFDFGGGPFPVPVPNSNVLIEETRAEAFVSDTWRFDDHWSLDGRLAGEYSRLKFSGDSNQTVTLGYLKPTLQLTRDFGSSNQLRLRVLRDVGQLDFTDFVSSASLTDERIEGGNPGLRPQTAWIADISAELRPGKEFAITLEAFHHWVTDTADFTPVGPPDALVDAPGNIGDATIFGVRAATRVPLPAMRGVTLNVDTTFQESSVTDPLTKEKRTISSFQKLQLAAGLRQDLPHLAWGLNYTRKGRTSDYLLSEIDRKRDSPSLDAFIEAPLARGLRLRFAVVSLLGEAQLRDRLFYTPDRRAALSSAEIGTRNPGRWCQLGISGSF